MMQEMPIVPAVGDFAAAVRAFLGLTRHSRLREQLRETLDLYEKAVTRPELGKAAANLAAVIEIQSTVLLGVIARPATRRKWDWGGVAVGLAVTAATAWGLYHLAALRQYLWGWFVLLFVGFWATMFFFVSWSLLVGRDKAPTTQVQPR
jgi:hypothetical protein